MPIDGIQGKSPGILLPFAGRTFPIHAKDSNKTPAKDQHDSVNVSLEGTEYSRVRGLVDATPDFRIDKVNRLAKQIADGTYNVKGELVADALIRRNLIDLSA